MSGAVQPASSMRCLISGTAAAASGSVHRDAHHLRPGLRQLDALLRRRARIGRVGHRHRLHDDRRAAADLDVTRRVTPTVLWSFTTDMNFP